MLKMAVMLLFPKGAKFRIYIFPVFGEDTFI